MANLIPTLYTDEYAVLVLKILRDNANELSMYSVHNDDILTHEIDILLKHIEKMEKMLSKEEE